MVIAQLAQLRRRRGLPATALSARTGIDTSAIYAFEHDRRDPRTTTTQSWARGLGARLVVVDTQGRATAAEIAEVIRSYVTAGDLNAATQALLQLATNLRSSDPLTVAALTIDEPPDAGDGWAWSIAGIVEIECQRCGIPIPGWASATRGDPTVRWNPWPPELSDLVDEQNVPDPLRRRGVFIEAGELESA